jgi:hypothetical protein
MELEKELVRFEKWVANVQSKLTDPSYVATASYDELRLAVGVLGLRRTVFPTQGKYLYRYQIIVTVPEIMQKLKVVAKSTP